MSAPLINRSLTTIRTELEFLQDSEVITEDLFNKLVEALPRKYQKDMEPWGVEKLSANTTANEQTFQPPVQPPQQHQAPPPSESAESLASKLESTSLNSSSRPAPPAPAPGPKPLSFCKSMYDFQAQQLEDLNLKKGDKIAVVEHLSEDWWKGYKSDEPSKIGVFPSNYVSSISESDFTGSEKAEYNPQEYKAPPQYQPPEQQYSQPQYMSPQQSYSYPQYPPPSTNYYQQPQQTVVEQNGDGQAHGQGHPHMRKFGSKLGNAAIFGAGATIGSDIVNSIF